MNLSHNGVPDMGCWLCHKYIALNMAVCCMLPGELAFVYMKQVEALKYDILLSINHILACSLLL